MSIEEPPVSQRRIDLRAVDAVALRLSRAQQAPWLHREVARRMAERLDIIRLKPKAVLDWCGFTGGGGDLLTKAYPHARRFIVEPTAELLARSRREQSASWKSPRTWVRSGAAVLAPNEVPADSVELLWSNLALHADIDPPALLAQWHRALVVDGFVMFSCLGPDTLRELRALYRRLEWPAPSIDFVDMHDLGDMMVAAGFADPVMDQETLTLTWESPQALLAELRSLGGNASPDRFAGLRGRRWLGSLHEELARMAGPLRDDAPGAGSTAPPALKVSSARSGRIAMSFEVAYGHAFRVPLRVKGGGETTVSLEQMRAMVKDGGRSGRL